jgi:hypothetical protein
VPAVPDPITTYEICDTFDGIVYAGTESKKILALPEVVPPPAPPPAVAKN